MNYVALDIGSSFIKAALLDTARGKILNERIEPQLPATGAGAGRFEVDAEALYQTAKALIDAYAREEQVAGVLLSTQMHGFILADAKGGPLTPYISWQDERCLMPMPGGKKTYLEHLKTVFSREDMKHASAYIKPYMALCNLYAMLDQGYSIQPGTHFCTLGSYLIFRLTGNNVCHVTNAGPTGFANVRDVAWDRAVIERAGCGALTFPRITDRLESCGRYRSLDIYPDLGDHQCSVLGIGAHARTDLIVNIGTAGQIACISDEFMWGTHESRPFFDGQYLNTISQMPGGRNLDIVIGLFADAIARYGVEGVTSREVWTRLIESIDRIDTGGLRVDTSFYQSADRPGGFIRGIRSANLTVECLVCACFQNIAEAYAEHAPRICPARGKLERIVFAGGLLGKTPLLRDMLSDRIGLPGVMSPGQSDAFRGLYRVAQVCSGRYPSVAAAPGV